MQTIIYRVGWALALFFLSLSAAFCQSDSSGTGVIGQALAPAKILAARHEFNENNMRGALTIYREVLDTDPTNVAALYGVAQCHYNLKRYDLALEYLDKTIKSRGSTTNDDLYFFGQCFHRTARTSADLDKAMDYFSRFRESAGKNSFEYSQAGRFLDQCALAKEMMAQPAPVTRRNLGEIINTRFEEYAPSITQDGNMLVFTSRRSGRIDKEGDFKYYEDIYYSERDSASGEWSSAEPLQGEVNTDTHDAVLSIAPDGSGIFVYKNNGSSAGDIFFSRRGKNGLSWYAPEKLPRPVNTSFFEGSISMTADGNTIYFVSERMDGMGLGDIYVSTKKGSSWSAPRNLGDVINTEWDEKFVFIHPNGKSLFFASNGHPGMGSYDIFKTELVNGEWSKPINLGYPINTVNEESTFSLTSDNKTMLIAAEYDDSYGDRDIYEVDVSGYDLIANGYDRSSYGQLLVMITDQNGAVLKGVRVQVYADGGKEESGSAVSDRNGYVRINVPGNKRYRIFASLGKGKTSKETEVFLELKEGGETVLRVPMVL